MSITPNCKSDLPMFKNVSAEIRMFKKPRLSRRELSVKSNVKSNGAGVGLDKSEFDDFDEDIITDISLYITKCTVFSEENRLTQEMQDKLMATVKVAFKTKQFVSKTKTDLLEILDLYNHIHDRNIFINPILMVELEVLIKMIDFGIEENISYFFDRLRRLVKTHKINE